MGVPDRPIIEVLPASSIVNKGLDSRTNPFLTWPNTSFHEGSTLAVITETNVSTPVPSISPRSGAESGGNSNLPTTLAQDHDGA